MGGTREADLRSWLTEFLDAHRGVRLGRLFGHTAAYAGRGVFAYVMEDGLVVKLPVDIARRERARGATPHGDRPGKEAWMAYRPRTAADARRLWPILELAARHVAGRQGESTDSSRSRRPADIA
jgi:hypothetical protein